MVDRPAPDCQTAAGDRFPGRWLPIPPTMHGDWRESGDDQWPRGREPRNRDRSRSAAPSL